MEMSLTWNITVEIGADQYNLKVEEGGKIEESQICFVAFFALLKYCYWNLLLCHEDCTINNTGKNNDVFSFVTRMTSPIKHAHEDEKQ